MNARLLGAFGVVLLAASLHGQRIDTVMTNLNFSEPRGITTDGSASYIADSGNNQILKYTKEGVTTVLAGKSGTLGRGYKDDIGTRAMFDDPQSIVYSAARNGLVVADYGNSAIRLIDINTRNVTTIGGGGGNGGGENADYQNGDANTSRFNFPAGVDVDTNSGTIYIADFGNGFIRALDGSNNTTTYADLNTNSPSSVSRPTAVAVGNPGELWVADNNNVIWLVISNSLGITVTHVAGQFNNPGADDADIGIKGRLSEPWGLLWRSWLGDSADLIVSDTGNNTLRRIFTNSAPDVQAYSLATFSGVPGQAGSVDDVIASATFNRPMGLSRGPSIGTFYIADSASSRIRIYTERTQPVEVLADPQIGYLTFNTLNQTYEFNPVTGSSKVFHNDPIAIVMTQSQNTDVTYLSAPWSSVIRDPIDTDSKLKPWSDASSDGTGVKLNSIYPDMIVKAIAEKTDGSTPSKVVHAEFVFQVGNPIVSGFNAANLTINNETTQFTPVMYYTLSDNGNDPPTPDFKDTVNSTKLAFTTLSLSIVADTVLWVKAFDPAEVAGKATHYQSSDTTKIKLRLADYQANQLVWGFESDEGSSQFIGAAGQNFYAPITLILIPGQSIYSFQFDSWIVGNVSGLDFSGLDSSALNPTNIVFRSDLKNSIGSQYVSIAPSYVYKNLVPTYLVVVTNSDGTQRKTVTDTNSVFDTILTVERINTMAVEWIASLDTNAVDLVSYSMPHDILHTSKEGRAFMGSLGFSIPNIAPASSVYQIQLDNVSGNGESKRSIPIQVVTGGSLSGGVSNSINSIKQVVVTNQSPKFLVGSALPFKWFNAGDFGSGTNIGAGDVLQTLEAYFLVNLPTNCDMYYALDSAPSDVYTNWNVDPLGEMQSLDAMSGNYDTTSASIDMTDVYVTFRRSLDPSLKWFNRYWMGGQLYTEETPNLLARPTNIIKQAAMPRSLRSSSKAVSSGPHSLKIRGSDLQTAPGQTLSVPINAEILGDAPVRTLLLSIRVVALDGSPEITDPISYDEADTLVTASKASKFTLPRGPNIFSAAWLDNTVEGVFGTNQIGTLLINVPSNATADSAYLVHFDKFSASPNGLAIFPSVVEDTLVTLSNRTGSSWNDGIPDTWRLRYFSTVLNDLSAAAADADGDGFSNLQEYQAGTNPLDPLSKPQSQPPSRPTLGLVGVINNPIPTFTMQWLSETGRSYFVETSQEAFGTNWMMISTNLPGSGAMTQFTDTNATGATRFYRLRAQ